MVFEFFVLQPLERSEMSIQTAFILGAGLGTRLRPMTNSRPKVLVPILGEPLIFRTLDYLLSYGITRFVINTHHLAHVFDIFFGGHHGEFSYRGAPLFLIYEPILLETAGAVRNARPWIGEDPFLVVNGDIVTNIALTRLLEASDKDDASVILGLRPGPPQVGLDIRTGAVLDFHNKLHKNGLSYFLFASLYVLRPEIYQWIPSSGPFRMMSVFWQLLAQNKRIAGLILDPGFWSEVGNRVAYLQVHQDLISQDASNKLVKSQISAGVELRGFCAIGENCEIEPGVILEDTIIWDKAKISSGSHLCRCILCDRVQVAGDFSDRDFYPG
ncbi:MAG: hypothetical protein C5B47_07910 [Verrucomicrobia bacterium]|nr:MAG: hypothetical protein C5B47_07910 [Verrucomicrobiota bacterium]